MYLLDSDVISLLFRYKGQQPHLERRILLASPDELYISFVTVDEIITGVYRIINNPKTIDGATKGCQLLRNMMRDLSTFQILAYEKNAKSVFDSMSAATKRIGTNDCKIAAIALSNNFTVVTRNVQHFQSIPNVKFEDWTKEKIVKK